MVISVASRIAYSGLTAAQVKINVTAANIANADTEGYSVKTATQSSLVAEGIAVGVSVTGVSSKVDRILLRSLMTAKSDLGAAETTADYADRLQSLMGSVSSDDDSGSSIAAAVTALESAASALATDPSDATAAAEFVLAADAMATQLRSLSASVQSLRGDADADIAATVSETNDALHTIDELNVAIVAARARGESSADLEDKRNAALATVAGALAVTFTVADTGAMTVATTGGQTLVGASVHELGFSAVAAMTADTVTSAITVDGRTLDPGSGTLEALLTLRDETLPATQDALDALAGALIDTLNAVTATGTAVPAPDSLTGTAAVAATDALDGSGTLHVAVLDADGAVVSTSDLDLSAYATVGDLVDALNGIDGISASIDADGHLAIATTAADTGVALGGDAVVGGDAASVAAAFGFNDLLTGTGAADIAVRATLLDDSGGLALGSLDDGATTVGSIALASGSQTVAQALAEALGASLNFSAAGRLSARSTDLAGYAAAIVSDVASVAARADTALTTAETVESNLSASLSSATGVNVDEETARLSQYQNLYSAAASVMEVANEMFSTLLDMVSSAT
ncbi:flagellar hook-associated protein FlgK [Prosthecodimorpha staleyi]|uniref:Flagellar hook-associated protein 1 n=1 Tax=Prosthecodimorpha staleyi TaxID=2840188 RepID=A0A947D2A4_9HYPH|nr:flagellar hook-associated protein FlgK [Prosthecodimorpha staleyi]MBT9289648.1 flagellar hook-associated protein FlgK [Prosthecodimorpha staleyi]